MARSRLEACAGLNVGVVRRGLMSRFCTPVPSHGSSIKNVLTSERTCFVGSRVGTP